LNSLLATPVPSLRQVTPQPYKPIPGVHASLKKCTIFFTAGSSGFGGFRSIPQQRRLRRSRGKFSLEHWSCLSVSRDSSVESTRRLNDLRVAKASGSRWRATFDAWLRFPCGRAPRRSWRRPPDASILASIQSTALGHAPSSLILSHPSSPTTAARCQRISEQTWSTPTT
jgi:hypothetical protein